MERGEVEFVKDGLTQIIVHAEIVLAKKRSRGEMFTQRCRGAEVQRIQRIAG